MLLVPVLTSQSQGMSFAGSWSVWHQDCFCQVRLWVVGSEVTSSMYGSSLIISLGGTSLLDPCEKETVDAASSLTPQERVNLTLSAQVWRERERERTGHVAFWMFVSCTAARFAIDSIREAPSRAWGWTAARVVYPGSKAWAIRRRRFRLASETRQNWTRNGRTSQRGITMTLTVSVSLFFLPDLCN